jgi:hypothetical protein
VLNFPYSLDIRSVSGAGQEKRGTEALVEAVRS